MASTEALAIKAEALAERQSKAAVEIAARLARIEEKLGIPAWEAPPPVQVNAMGEEIQVHPKTPLKDMNFADVRPKVFGGVPQPVHAIPASKPPLIPQKGETK